MLSSPIDEIKSRLDIVEVIRSYIKLQKAGANYRAVCPFHSEKKPSFFVSPARQIWHCFGCQKGGDIFGFVKEIEGVEFGDALRILAQRAGVELKKQDPKIRSQRQRLYEISDLACRFFEKQLKESSSGREAKKYLLSRGIKEETIKEWRLGYAPDTWEGLSDFLVSRGCKKEETAQAGLILKSEKTNNFYDRFRGRIIFPIFDLASQVIGFGARVLELEGQKNDEVAKYVNTPSTFLYDKSRVLYGLNKAGKEIRKKDSCILVEGYMDVITAHQAGFENVVATSGTALTPWQLNIIKRYSDNLLTAFDMDIAGDNATKRGIGLAQSQDFNIKIITMPKDKDPADVISENPQEWQNLVEKAKSIHDFYFENTLARFDKNTLDGKKGISKILLPVIKRISNKIEQNFWIQSLVRALRTKEENILEELSKTNFSQDEFGAINQVDKELVSSPQKTRRELLEEYLLTLAFKRSENLNLVKEDDFVLLSLPTIKLINCSLGKEKQEELSQELQDKMNYLFFKTEFLEIDSAQVEAEFKNCLQEIKTLALKNKLDDISKEIKKAEEEKNFEKVQELVHKFYNLCQERKF